jgi:hypothetical protein
MEGGLELLEGVGIAFGSALFTVWLSSWYATAVRSDDLELARHVRDIGRVAGRIEDYWLHHHTMHDIGMDASRREVMRLARKVEIAGEIVVRNHDEVTKLLPAIDIRKARRRYAEGFATATGGAFSSPESDAGEDGLDRLFESLGNLQEVIAILEDERTRRGRLVLGAPRLFYRWLGDTVGFRYVEPGYD